MMDAAFGWIGAIVEFLASLLPRMVIVRSTHGGVRYRMGSKVLEVTPGIRWYWPLVTEIETFPSVDVAEDLEAQVLTTVDGFTVRVQATLDYRVVDMVQFLTENHDSEKSLMNLAQIAVRDVVVRNTLEDLMACGEDIDEELLETGKELLTDRFGVVLNALKAPQLSKTRSLALHTDGG